MSKTLARATFKVILPGLAAGGLCGAAAGAGLVDRGWAVAAAIGVALFTGLSVLRIRRRFKAGMTAAPAQSDI
ncbi:hypothetical protein SRABI118_02756 [Massilia sp. Bi118]|uniref:hypothetical protein n=1 Tax=Massilia sp. Bi118 TaxID=2822346 RepID=UPI001D25ED2F|nr:hypothetical protein [Massilia sp. Bi118]CAH0242578.1 hypothetical protein SRABI118_02756 [Massilia sp. Bi118]